LDDKRYNICSLLQEKVYDFKIIYGDTDSLFVTNVKKDNDVMKFIAVFNQLEDRVLCCEKVTAVDNFIFS
jgi:DNA polymerase elongation subunit (family B)